MEYRRSSNRRYPSNRSYCWTEPGVETATVAFHPRYTVDQLTQTPKVFGLLSGRPGDLCIDIRKYSLARREASSSQVGK